MSIYKHTHHIKCQQFIAHSLTMLPPFCKIYVNGREGVISSQTLLIYVRRFFVFFDYVKSLGVHDISLEYLASFTIHDVEDFAHWLRYHPAKKPLSERSINHYLTAISSLYDYFIRTGDLTKNPVRLMERKSIKRSRNVIYIDDTEKFLGASKLGVGLSDVQLRYFHKTSIRDYAICMLLLRTGIRVSELVGIDVDDVDFEECSVNILRKRDKADIVYFDDETKAVLLDYLDERALYVTNKKEPALFIVTIGKFKGTRLSVRSIERLIKKYALSSGIKNASKITPHRLRATFAHDMLNATGDIRLVQEALDHESADTTSVYLNTRQEHLKNNRNIISKYKQEQA